MAMKRAPLSTLFSKLLNLSPLRTASLASPTLSCSFNANAQPQPQPQPTNFNSVDVERQSARSVPRRRDSPRLFSDAFDPFSATRSLSQVLNLMDQFTDHPFLSSPSLSSRKGWDMREDNSALSFRIEMSGLSKEDVKISVEQNTLIIRGEGGKDWDDDEEGDGGRRYSSRLDLPPTVYKLDEIKAEMKNAVLRVVVPKVKEEERKEVYQVTVE
ncbi:hypothetical protein V6N13_109854 [Hibiscus sabdariffa]|uniref:SHSP domain-containing protein n=1 Tax=Hibiscus sabdariffa TaxID=183260 RepID=A0ABR2FQT0_9ROSI